jgi:hypothetical protein
MKKTVGTADAVARVILAAVIAGLYFLGKISGGVAVAAGILAAILVLTAVTGYCPLFSMLGISTRKREPGTK